MTYCIAIWGNCSPALFDKIENIYARAARVIYKLPSEFPNERSLVMANWQPLSYIYVIHYVIQKEDIISYPSDLL